ncbi:carboxymuconolactone decarboxylase family protein [Amycolatopsis decaplanina]|uniref:Carboxymuconolactone decarboxylase n=1 Tax=Amycolatopsis decaplanina DSM 44594 TaxID=1284240 RepID=M2ZSE1_9PSEU|nr:carboxymuconolactone decarboxylase family protein [Amycolatopsis decaplanina]EME63703.1 carboxymuconolactone decarboxylase [Amycolatopsis decaplanina DSM 44594]
MGDYDKGLELLRLLGGVEDPAVLELFDAVDATDYGREAVAFVYGGVYQRPGLSLAQRQLVTVAALEALGYAEAQLRFHETAVTNVGGDLDQDDETTRRLRRIAVGTAKGGVAPELADVLREARDAGELREAVEAILHLAVYVGFPAALNALGVARTLTGDEHRERD